MNDSIIIESHSSIDEMISLFGKLNPNNSFTTYEKSDNSFAVDISGLIKFDFFTEKYIFYIKPLSDKTKHESNPIEFLNAMNGMIIDESRIINDGKQVEFLIRWDIQDLTFSQLNILKQNLHPLEINIYKESEIKNHSGEYHLGLVFDFDNEVKIILESTKN